MLGGIRGLFKPKRHAEIFTSSNTQRLARSEAAFTFDDRVEFDLVKAYPGHLFQSVIGFGGALTEASASVFFSLGEDNQRKVIDHYFSREGCGYNLCRTHIQSCDFAHGNYAYVSDRGDDALTSFSLDRDREKLIPLIQRAAERNDQLEVLASPWSPPAFMKTNNTMNRGGRLKETHYRLWAQVIARYVQELQGLGVPVTRVTAQNEPLAAQPWDSCLYSAEEEQRFITGHLRPALDETGLENVAILAWDHNKDRIVDRLDALLECGGLDAIDGLAFHWYTGDHFEALAHAASQLGSKELIMTEMCLGFSGVEADDGVSQAELYAHEMIGDFNAGAQGFIDWNMLLDEKGGPNHVRNFCNAPLMADTKTDTLYIGPESTYIAHFSRFVKRGARRMLVSRSSQAIEATGFVNPDGSRVAIILNRMEGGYDLKLAEGEHVLRHTLGPHSIASIVWEG